jgi:hypothetical protein
METPTVSDVNLHSEIWERAAWGVAKSKAERTKRMKWKFNTEETEPRASEVSAYDAPPPLIESQKAQHPVARGFAQAFALHPVLALTAIVTDCMVSAVDVASLGVSAPVLWLIASFFVGVIVFMGQKKWAGDDAESAFIKALIVAFLTALPTPLPSFLTVPSAVVGVVHTLRRKP